MKREQERLERWHAIYDRMLIVRDDIAKSKPLSRDELLIELKRIANDDNCYSMHELADLLILQHLGDRGVTEAWEYLDKWFS